MIRKASDVKLNVLPLLISVEHLFYYEGYHTDEIAHMTGEREGTVRSRLSRARKKLRILMEEPEK